MTARRYRQYQIAQELSDSGEEMVLASDYNALEARVRVLEEALEDCASLLEEIEPEVRGGYSPDGALVKARAALAGKEEKR